MAKEGRPPLWTDPKKLQVLIDKYFDDTDRPTFAGLAYALGIARSTLYEYADKNEFSDTIKKARERMFQKYEELLIYSKKANTVGVIFALKNTGWSDKTDVTSGGEPIKPLLGGISDGNNNSNGKVKQTSEKN